MLKFRKTHAAANQTGTLQQLAGTMPNAERLDAKNR